MSVPKLEVIKLYRLMLKEAKKFPAYNFRTYALRRIQHGFEENKNLKDTADIKAKYEDGLKNFEILKRQVILTGLYKVENIVVENTRQESFISDIKAV